MKIMNKKKSFVNKRLLSVVSVLFAAGFFVGISYGCVWRRHFGFECPSCGLSRAYLAVFHGDFAAALEYHPMFWYPPLAALYCCLRRSVFTKRVDAVLLGAATVGYIVLYAVKLTN